MTAPGDLGRRLVDLLGAPASVTEAYGDVHVDVDAARWVTAMTAARDDLRLTFLDWLSAYWVPPVSGTPRELAVVAHVAADAPGARLLVRTRVDTEDPSVPPSLPTLTALWPGAAWHERETWEMFGLDFAGHPDLRPLLLQPEFDGRPLRKDFVLASRVVRDWPGAKDPAETPGRPRRRPPLPPGVPSDWGQK